MQTYQSLREVDRIFAEWKDNFAPKDLLFTNANVDALVAYTALHFGGIVSITNLDAALANLPNLERAPKKTALEIDAEFRKREFKRVQKEAAENVKPFDQTALIQKEADKKASDKEVAMIQSQIKSAIESYECYRAGRTDFTTTASRKKELWAYHAANTRRDQKKVLVEIRQMVVDFPNRDERSKR